MSLRRLPIKYEIFESKQENIKTRNNGIFYGSFFFKTLLFLPGCKKLEMFAIDGDTIETYNKGMEGVETSESHSRVCISRTSPLRYPPPLINKQKEFNSSTERFL